MNLNSPLRLSAEDKYKYAVKVLFDDNFCTQYTEVLEKVSFTYAVLKKKNVEKHNMQGTKLDSFFINISNVKNCGNCVNGCVWLQVKNQSNVYL